MRLKIGAATSAAVVAAPCGVSMTTMIVSAGLRDGKNPTNDALYSASSSGR